MEWEVVDVTPVKGPMGKFQIPQTAIDSVNRNGIGLKGPLMTPVGKGHQSLNLALRKYVFRLFPHSWFWCVLRKDLVSVFDECLLIAAPGHQGLSNIAIKRGV